jgi:hypothetical protein
MGSKSRKIILNGAILLSLMMLPPGIASESPPCMAYAYTIDRGENHLSLISSDSYVFGTKIAVVGNCGNNQLIIDEELVASSNNSIEAYGKVGKHDVSIISGNYSATFTNVTFIEQGQLGILVGNLPAQHNPHSSPYTIDEINSIELWSGVGAILLSWFVVTSDG